MKKYNTCDPKYYGSGVNNCDNVIKCLREIRFRIYDKKCKSYIGDETRFTLQN